MATKAAVTDFSCALVVSVCTLRVPAWSQAPIGGSARPALDDAFQTSVKPFLQTYCYACHSGTQPAAGFDLTAYSSAAAP